MKPREIARKQMTSCKIYERAASWHRAKASLGAGPRLHQLANPRHLKSSKCNERHGKKTQETLMKTINTDEIAASWYRTKGSSGPGFRFQRSANPQSPKSWKHTGVHDISWNLKKSSENVCIDKIAASWYREHARAFLSRWARKR